MQAALTQSEHQPLALVSQVAILLAATEGYLDDIPLKEVPDFEAGLLAFMDLELPALSAEINRSGVLTDEARAALVEHIETFHQRWLQGER